MINGIKNGSVSNNTITCINNYYNPSNSQTTAPIWISASHEGNYITPNDILTISNNVIKIKDSSIFTVGGIYLYGLGTNISVTNNVIKYQSSFSTSSYGIVMQDRHYNNYGISGNDSVYYFGDYITFSGNSITGFPSNTIHDNICRDPSVCQDISKTNIDVLEPTSSPNIFY